MARLEQSSIDLQTALSGPIQVIPGNASSPAPEVHGLRPTSNEGTGLKAILPGATYRLPDDTSPIGQLKHSLSTCNHWTELKLLFERQGMLPIPEDDEEFIELDVLDLPNSDTQKLPLLQMFMASRWEQFKLLQKERDLDMAICLECNVLRATPDDDPAKSERYTKLGTSHAYRFELRGKLEDIKEAAKFMESAVRLTTDDHPDKPKRLNNLGTSYSCLFQRLGKLEDLHKAIAFQEQAISLAPDYHPCLNNLGNSYQLLFERLGKPEDLDKSIELKEKAVLLTPDGHSAKPARLNNLASSYQCLFERFGELEDLDKAIGCQERALQLAPDNHSDRATLLSSLGTSHWLLYERLGRIEDLDKSIIHKTQAVQLTPEDHPDRHMWLNNLGNSYQQLFRRLGKSEDLNKAIIHQEQAFLLTPDDHPHKTTVLNSLGVSYEYLFEHLGKIEDLNMSIKCMKQVVMMTPDGHSYKPGWLHNLGILYDCLFGRHGRLDDLHNSIKYEHQAVVLTSDGDPDKTILLNALGSAYKALYSRLRKHEDARKAIRCFKSATLLPTGFPLARLTAAHAWASITVNLQLSPLEAYTQCMVLLPQVVWIGSSVERRFEALTSDVRSLVTGAVAEAISSKRHSLALEWLETGRSIIWNQILQLRTPLEALAGVDDDLAKQLKQVASDLEQASSLKPGSAERLLDSPSPHRIAQQHRHLAASWNKLIDQARCLPGFHGFLRPKPFSELASEARASTIVVINLHPDQCDAIALKPGSTATHELLGSLEGTRVRVRNQRRPVFDSFHAQDQFESVLSTLWTAIVRPILDGLGYLRTPSKEELPHITWCTTGPLAFLPLHAAGCYDQPMPRVFEFVSSSYTPTLSSLLKPARTPSEFRGILAVGQAATAAGGAPLPGTILELDHVQTLADSLAFMRLEGSSATTGAVRSALESHSWVHLACHASQNASDPSESAFQLYDGSLSLATITKKSLPHADFAFLSACQTAMGDESLPDEAVHLAAGMLMVGYSSVIATMWSIKDEDAPLVAEEVYAEMLKGGVPDSRKAARALHNATRSLRKKTGEKNFARWVPFIHMGC